MAEEKKEIGFNPIFDWLAEDVSLSSTEKIIVAHILRRGKRGCYESRGTFAGSIGIDERTLERSAKKLYAMEVITFGYHTKPKTYYVTTEFLKGKAVFDCLKGCGKPVSFAVKSLKIHRNQGGRFVRIGGQVAALWGAFCHLFNRKKKDLSYTEDREERIREKISHIISDEREKKQRMSKAEFEDKRQEYHRQLESEDDVHR